MGCGYSTAEGEDPVEKNFVEATPDWTQVGLIGWTEMQLEEANEDVYYRIYFGQDKPRQCRQKCWFFSKGCCSIVCWIVCCPPCTPFIIHKLVIDSPLQPTYKFVETGGTDSNNFLLHVSEDAKMLTQFPYRKDREHLALMGSTLTKMRCFYVYNKKGQKLACAYFRRESSGSGAESSEARTTVLYSCSRNQDIGLSMDDITSYSSKLDMDVFVYDYSGCGLSEGARREQHMYDNIELMYEHLTKELGVPWQKILVIGTSLGTAPSIHLASRFEIGGLVLQGSFLSILKKPCPQFRATCCLDKFRNSEKIKDVTCPTLFVHGAKDDVFDVQHMRILKDHCPGATGIQPYIVPGSKHNDFWSGKHYWPRLKLFIKEEAKINPNLQVDTTLEQIYAGYQSSTGGEVNAAAAPPGETDNLTSDGGGGLV